MHALLQQRMSTPVVTNKWVGSFDCDTCRQKRLTADQFSKRALERHRNEGIALKCKRCVTASEGIERTQAAMARKEQNKDSEGADETRLCAGKCGKTIPKSAFNRSQWSKGEGKSRCSKCVEAAVQEESELLAKSKQDKMAAALRKVEEARKGGNAQSIFAAESELAALEAEKVTGLKPVRMAGRGGRGRGRGRGRGK